MLNRWQAQELLKCSRNPLYMIRNYGFIRHPALDFPLRAVLWDWQELLIWLWWNRHSTIILKSRQLGFSWTIAAYANAVMNFIPGVEIPLLSSNEDKAIELLSKVTFFYDHMPDWLRARQVERSKTRLSVQIRYYDDILGVWRWGTSTVSSLTTTGTSGAGLSSRRLFIDEFALFGETGRKGMDEAAYASSALTTVHGGAVSIGSTPRGYGGAFRRIWIAAAAPFIDAGMVHDFMPYREWNRLILQDLRLGAMVPLKCHYSMCYHDAEWIDSACRGLAKTREKQVRDYFTGLAYDTAWRDEQARRLKLSKPQVMQEFELFFEQPGNPAFSSEDLQACYVPRNNPRIRELAAESKSYFIGVDTAEGISKKNVEPDYNSLVVLNDVGVQVDALHNRNPIGDWAGQTQRDPVSGELIELKGDVLRKVEEYTPCEVMVEKNGPGLVVVNRIQSLLPQEARLVVESMSGAIKPKLVSDLQLALQERRIVITDYFTYQTMMQYTIVGPGKFEASPGFFDDPVVALLWAVYLMSTKGAYHILWNVDRKSTRAVGSSLEEDVSPEEIKRAKSGLGPMVGQPAFVHSAESLRETDTLPFLGKKLGGKRWEYYDRNPSLRSRRLRKPTKQR